MLKSTIPQEASIWFLGTLPASPYTGATYGVWTLGSVNTSNGLKSLIVQVPSNILPGNDGYPVGNQTLDPKLVVNQIGFDGTTGFQREQEIPQQEQPLTAISSSLAIRYCGYFAYNLFRGFNVSPTSTFVMASPIASNSFTLANDPLNSTNSSMIFTSLNKNLDPGLPEEHEGGFLYRIASHRWPSARMDRISSFSQRISHLLLQD